MWKKQYFNFFLHGLVILLLLLLFLIIYYRKNYEEKERSPVVIDKNAINTVIPTFEPEPETTMIVSTNVYYISPSGDDKNSGTGENSPFKSIQKAVDLALPGDVIKLLPGEYLQDIVSKRSGTASHQIMINGVKDAIVKGGGNGRVIEINHDYLQLTGFTVDGLHGDPSKEESYRDKLIYVLGKSLKKGVVGLKISSMTIKNAGGECVRLRYFAQNNEIAYNSINRCGAVDFTFQGGGKNGEGIYIGTAPEQRKDGKNPTADVDESSNNWIHHNSINTQGNECVDIKEGSSGNIVEYNNCTGQKDKESGGLDSRGSKNIFRYNEIYGNLGAGVRLGGDKKSDGINNDVYSNAIKNNSSGGIKFQRSPQGRVCDNKMENNTGGDSVGDSADKFKPTDPCG